MFDCSVLRNVDCWSGQLIGGCSGVKTLEHPLPESFLKILVKGQPYFYLGGKKVNVGGDDNFRTNLCSHHNHNFGRESGCGNEGGLKRYVKMIEFMCNEIKTSELLEEESLSYIYNPNQEFYVGINKRLLIKCALNLSIMCGWKLCINKTELKQIVEYVWKKEIPMPPSIGVFTTNIPNCGSNISIGTGRLLTQTRINQEKHITGIEFLFGEEEKTTCLGFIVIFGESHKDMLDDKYNWKKLVKINYNGIGFDIGLI